MFGLPTCNILCNLEFVQLVLWNRLEVKLFDGFDFESNSQIRMSTAKEILNERRIIGMITVNNNNNNKTLNK